MTGQTEIPARIRLGIAAKGLTQTELGKRLGITKQSIGQMLGGRNPGTRHWAAIAQILECTVEWLVNGTGPAPSWAVEGADLPLPLNDQLREARTIIRALSLQLEALQLENVQQAERIEALEAARRTKPPRAGGQ